MESDRRLYAHTADWIRFCSSLSQLQDDQLQIASATCTCAKVGAVERAQLVEAVVDLGRSGLCLPQFFHGGVRQVAFGILSPPVVIEFKSSPACPRPRRSTKT